MFFSVVISTYEPHNHFIARVLFMLAQQTCRDFEALIVQDGKDASPLESYARQVQAHYDLNVSVSRLLPSPFGNETRRFGAQMARGDYVVWLSADNLILPNYLQQHADNIAAQPGCVSVVNVDWWQKGKFGGTMPTGLGHGEVDLLCWSCPAAIARQLDVFKSENRDADGEAFTACSQNAAVVWNVDWPVAGCHF